MLLSNWHCLATIVIWCWGREGGSLPRPSVPREGGRLASWSDWLQTQGHRLPRDYQIPPAAGTREGGSKGEIPCGLLPVGEGGGGEKEDRNRRMKTVFDKIHANIHALGLSMLHMVWLREEMCLSVQLVLEGASSNVSLNLTLHTLTEWFPPPWPLLLLSHLL